MSNKIELPHVVDVVSYLVNARFQDSMSVIQTAHNIHNCFLVPCPLGLHRSILASYPRLKGISDNGPLILTPVVQAYIEQLPPSSASTIFDEDVLFWARARLVKFYRTCLMRRTDQLLQTETRIDAPFPPMTTTEEQDRVTYVVERAETILLEQVVDWWVEVTCGVALNSPSEEELTALAVMCPNSKDEYRQINSWRQIGYIIEVLER